MPDAYARHDAILRRAISQRRRPLQGHRRRRPGGFPHRPRRHRRRPYCPTRRSGRAVGGLRPGGAAARAHGAACRSRSIPIPTATTAPRCSTAWDGCWLRPRRPGAALRGHYASGLGSAAAGGRHCATWGSIGSKTWSSLAASSKLLASRCFPGISLPCEHSNSIRNNLPSQPTAFLGREMTSPLWRAAAARGGAHGDADRARRHRQESPVAAGSAHACCSIFLTASGSSNWRRSPIRSSCRRRSPRPSSVRGAGATPVGAPVPGVGRQADAIGAGQLRAGHPARHQPCHCCSPAASPEDSRHQPGRSACARRARVPGRPAGVTSPLPAAHSGASDAVRSGAAVHRARTSGASRLRRRQCLRARPWPKSATAWTDCPWRSNWLRRGCGCSTPRPCWQGWKSGCRC